MAIATRTSRGPTARTRATAIALVCAAAILPAPRAGRAAPQPSLRFGPPVLVSPELSEAWEPSMLIDRFGNVFITARKTTTQLILAPDDRSPTRSRSMSWLWVSSDGGRTFGNLPGYPLDAENHDFGYEGDISLDDAGHLYFADQTYADSTITRWTITGRGAFAIDFHRPFLPTAQPLDDRPWLAAHGNGRVFYIVNTGDPTLNPLGREGGDAYGPGRFSIYRSTDGAATFDPFGHSLRESGGCRPAADHRPGSGLVYVACTNDGGAQQGLLEVPHGRGTLWAYVSEDDGATYARYRVGDYNADAETYDWPLVAVGPDGGIWVLHVDADKVEQQEDSFRILTNRLLLYHSTDRGRTWSRQDVTPRTGRYRWGWLVVSPSGDLALAIQHRPNETSPWRAYAAVFAPGSTPSLVSMDANPIASASSAEPPSEIMGLAFAPDQTLAVAWTRVETLQGLRFRRVYFARSLQPQPAPRTTVAGVRRARPLPATGLAVPATTGLAALGSSILLASWLILPRRPARTLSEQRGRRRPEAR